MYTCIAMGKIWKYFQKCMPVKVSLWAFEYMCVYYCSCEYANVCACVYVFVVNMYLCV